MFKFRKIFLIALLAGTLGVIGCADDTTPPGNGGSGGEGTAGTGGEGTAGTGGEGTAGTGGNGNGSVCDDCANQSDIALCEVCYDECDNPNEAACVAIGLACCATI